MTLNDLLNNSEAAWIKGEEGGTPVVHEKLFLTRNLKGYPFPETSSASDKKEIADEIRKAVLFWNSHNDDQLLEYPLEALNNNEKTILEQKSYLPLTKESLAPGMSLYMNHDGDVSLSVNKGDDLRIQLFAPFSKAENLWYRASYLDDVLSEKLPVAFDDEFGYLTSKADNAGTGLVLSALLFIPGLAYENRIGMINNRAARLGFTVKSLIPNEFMNVPLFEIYSNVSIGINESDYYQSFYSLLQDITHDELNAWDEVYHENENELKDKIWRAIGIMKYARNMNSDEVAQYISSLAMGMREKLLPETKLSIFQKIFNLSSSELVNELTSQENKGLGYTNSWRALLLRQYISQLHL